MKKVLAVLGGALVVGLMVLMSFAPAVGAQSATTKTPRIMLPKSPYSTSVLVAQAIHSGKYKVASHSGATIINSSCGTPPCALPNVLASENNTGAPVNEDPIATNPTHHEHLLSGGNDYNCASLQGFFTSGDGGLTWRQTCLNVLPGAFGEGDPGVGYDLRNVAFATGIDGGTADGSDIVYEKSSDNGKTWSAPAVAVKPFFSGGLTDKDWLQVDDSPTSRLRNSLYISVTQFDSSSNSTITVSHSKDHGATWTEVQVDTVQLFPNVDQFSDITTGKDGTVYATWMRCLANGPTGDCGGTVATLLMSTSHDGGNTWSTPSVIASPNLAPDSCGAFYGCLQHTFERVSEIPAIGVDNSSRHPGNLYVTYYNWTGTDQQVQVATSTNGGSSWSSVAVSPSTSGDQFFPWLTVNGNGIVGITWLDRRNDPANVNYEAFGTLSTNGSTFISDIQIASVASNPFNDGFGGGFMGDYTGNAWAGGKLYESWMDTRSGVVTQDFVGGIENNP